MPSPLISQDRIRELMTPAVSALDERLNGFYQWASHFQDLLADLAGDITASMERDERSLRQRAYTNDTGALTYAGVIAMGCPKPGSAWLITQITWFSMGSGAHVTAILDEPNPYGDPTDPTTYKGGIGIWTSAANGTGDGGSVGTEIYVPANRHLYFMRPVEAGEGFQIAIHYRLLQEDAD